MKTFGAQTNCVLDRIKPYQAVTEAAWNAQTRLHQRYKHLTGVGRKKSQVAAAALGRELSGFVWAIGRMVKPHPVKPELAKAKAA